ncbi:ABC transporter substrate-binding protein [Pseudalkalibacillus caeni]|uniref:ABC transporter substrate-binding protein n=1 Tax=Exobacillus caeni TaxID=2574798 RepID=A0A5R9FEV4_9BACL|nr:ABC transporter substrate-binding protein [Pseudalkalibacillus caeni]TLS38105.1 ABC transporter substrate-binding protein [Pseudalkalibacillus caeni]
MLRGWKKLVGVSIISVMALAGCGSNNASTNSDSGSAGGGESDGKTYTVGVSQFVEHPSLDAAFEGFKKGLEDNGLKEGDNVEYDVQNAQADMNNTNTIAKNLVGDKVDLIFANATPSAQAALNATQDIPIVFTSVTDPVGAKLVESFDKPGPNITGTTDTHPDAIPNTIKFIADEFDAKTVGMIYNAGEQNSVAQVDIVKKAMEGTGLKAVEKSVSTSAEVKQAAEALVGKADVIYIITDNTVVSALESVISVAYDNDIPMFAGELDSVERGAFAAYGFDYADIGYEAGVMAAQILKGEKTADQLEVQHPQNLKLVINKEAAKEMGIEIKPEWEDKAEIK